MTTKITTAMKTNSTFYTDSNGRDFIKRVYLSLPCINKYSKMCFPIVLSNEFLEKLTIGFLPLILVQVDLHY